MNIEIWTKNNCKYCREIKDILLIEGCDYTAILANDRLEDFYEIKEKYKFRTFPVVFIDGIYIGGFNEAMRKLGLEKHVKPHNAGCQ